MSTEVTREYFLENLADFDKSRVVLDDPVTSKFKMGGADIVNCVSNGYYLDDQGNKCELYIPLPPQSCFGVNYNFALNASEDEKVPENATGAQIAYPMTSMKTIAKPTADEQAAIDVFNGIWEVSKDRTLEFATSEDEDLVPPPTRASVAAVSVAKKKDWTKAVKVPFDYPTAKDGKSKDTTKPMRTYFKLVTSKRNNVLKILTPFYGPGDKKVNAVQFIDVRGVITPCVKWEGVYFGAHGNTAPHGASLRFKVTEANFTPQVSSALPSKRMLGKNNSVSSEDDDEEEDHSRMDKRNGGRDLSGEAEGFQAPGSDSKNPMADLSKAAKTTKPEPKKATKPQTKPKPKTEVPVEEDEEETPTPKKPAPKKAPVKTTATATESSEKKPAVKSVAKKAAPAPKKKPVAKPEADETEIEEDEE